MLFLIQVSNLVTNTWQYLFIYCCVFRPLMPSSGSWYNNYCLLQICTLTIVQMLIRVWTFCLGSLKRVDEMGSGRWDWDKRTGRAWASGEHCGVVKDANFGSYNSKPSSRRLTWIRSAELWVVAVNICINLSANASSPYGTVSCPVSWLLRYWHAL
jgi:hypothetical protein